MNEHQLSELLDKYLDGTCTTEEKQLIDNWFELHEDKPGFTESLPDGKREALKRRMFNVITHANNIKMPQPIIRPLYKNWWLRIAVAAVLLIFTKFILIDTILTQAKFTETAPAETFVINRTKNIVKQLLPDSSVVWLNPNASLSYPKVFGAASRNVTMQGECFFEVTKNARRPFIISSEHIITKVWGTSFRVLDNKTVSVAIVTVVTGKVSVSKKGSKADRAGAKLAAGELILLPKDEAIYHKNTDLLLASRQADLSALNIYKHIDLSFENARLTEIVRVLEQKFNTQIKIQDESLNKAVMTADLTGLNLPEVLEVLKASMKLNYEISNDFIVLKKTN